MNTPGFSGALTSGAHSLLEQVKLLEGRVTAGHSALYPRPRVLLRGHYERRATLSMQTGTRVSLEVCVTAGPCEKACGRRRWRGG